jgi:hypothetical protein
MKNGKKQRVILMPRGKTSVPRAEIIRVIKQLKALREQRAKQTVTDGKK